MLYQIKCDGALVYSSASEEMAHIVLNPKLALDINDAGTLDFTLPPGNAMHGGLKKLKSVITMERDSQEIFRGRVLEDETDIYNQRLVYCEGQKSFLADSQIAPYTYTGTVRGLYTKLMNNHNTKADASKRFSVGIIDAVSDSETVTVENKNYASTESEIESKLLGVYGGYLRERTVGNTRYLDWVKEYGGTNSQEIRFAVNLLDLRNKVSAKDVFTVLYPLGAVQVNEEGEYTDMLTVASVNGGLEYIQNDAAVALFGRIERSHTWNHIESATELLAKGNEYLKTGIAVQTLTLKAIDMHIIDGSISAINIGDKVRIVSDPHGIDLTMVCSRIVIDPVNPENTEYTFGENPRVLSDNVADTGDDVDGMNGRGGGKSLEEEVQDIIRWAEINVSKANAQILLSAGEIDNLKERTSEAEIAIDGANAQITLAASRMDDLEQRTSSAEIAIDGVEADIRLHAESISDLEGLMTQAEIDIDGLEAEITLRASKKSVDDLTSRVSQAEIDIDGANAAIKLKASQTTVDNLTKRVSAAEVDIDGANAAIKLHAGSIEDLEGLMTQAEIDIDGLNAEITLKVSKDGVVSAINQTAEEVLIKASKINLSGYVTASQLSAEIADINLNMANTVATDTLRASSAIISFLTFQDTYCTLKSGNFVTSVTFPVYQEANLYYLDWDGNKQSKLVLTPTKNTVGSYAKNKDYKYIGA